MKVNLGCGHSYLEGWLNVDADPEVRADVYAEAFEFVREHGSECDEIYMGHLLQQLMPDAARDLLALMAVRLPAGATVSAVCVDADAIFDAYRAGEIDNRTLNEKYLFGYVYSSTHRWLFDEPTLVNTFRAAGLADVESIDLRARAAESSDNAVACWRIGAVGRAHGDPHLVARSETSSPKIGREVAPPATPDRPLTPHEELLLRLGDLEDVAASERRHREGLAERTRRLASDDRILHKMVEELRQDRDRVERERVVAVLAYQQLQQDADGEIDSRAYAMALRLRQASKLILPPGSGRRAVAFRVLGKRGGTPPAK